MKRMILLLLVFLLCLAPCMAEEQNTTVPAQTIILTVNGTEVPVMWEDNYTTQELQEFLPMTIRMTRFGGLQQVGYMKQKIQGSDIQTDAEPGDIILFEDRWIMLFYGYHSGKYTRLGHIPTDLTEEEEKEIEENKDKTADQLEEEQEKETAKEFKEIEKETEKKMEAIQVSSLEEAEKQERQKN